MNGLTSLLDSSRFYLISSEEERRQNLGLVLNAQYFSRDYIGQFWLGVQMSSLQEINYFTESLKIGRLQFIMTLILNFQMLPT